MKLILVRYKDRLFGSLVDDKDYDYLNQFKWYLRGKGYAVRNHLRCGKKTSMRMHREIMNCSHDKQIDHINRNKLDNRKCNLRFCTNSQNKMNSKGYRMSSSKYKGVYFHKGNNKWCAEINFNNKQKYLGIFKIEKEAALVYNQAAIKYHGEFACLNEVNA